MKKLLLTVSVLILTVLLTYGQGEKKAVSSYHLPAGISKNDYLPNTVIVKFKNNPSSGKSVKVQGRSYSVSLKSASISQLIQKFPASGSSISVKAETDTVGLDRIYELKFSEAPAIESVIAELNSDPSVEYAEPVYIRHIFYSPNDPRYTANIQAYLDQIKAPLAWNLVRNTRSVIIGIVDSGSELTHEDLAANIYFNTNDPINGVDDDHDGYIDNYQGWDFVGATAANIKEDNDPNVKNGAAVHGVHVSGIAGAVTDNGKGVASVSFNNGKLLIVKVGADDNGSDIYRGYEGIKYAVDHGAQVINCSWGGESRSEFEQDVIDYAVSKGALIVAAAGNSGSNVPQYPAGYDGVIGVANIQLDDTKASTSNFGTYVSISAPGSSIMSTYYSNTYNYSSGTSMASPVVAGAAALVKAYFPSLTMQQVGQQLRVTADNIDSKNSGFEKQLGAGRINVYRALTETSPSIRKQNLTILDKGNGTLPSGDTVSVFADFKNLLFPVTNLQVRLVSNSADVVIVDGVKNIGSLGQLNSASNIGPFKFYIKPGIEDNTPVEFFFQYTGNGGAYNDFEGFTLLVSRDYLNFVTSTIQTTVTSRGRIGFSVPQGDDGSLGFRYKGTPLLYEAALMIGNSPERVSNCARSTGNNYDDHFVMLKKITPLDSANYFQGLTKFDDSGSPNPLNIQVSQKATVVKQGKDNYIINEYIIANKSDTDINNLFAGLFTDWDIDISGTNATQYDSAEKLAYVYNKKNPSLPYGGVKVLSDNSAVGYYPLSIDIPDDPLDGDFTIAEKFETLSSGVKTDWPGANSTNGLDVSFVTSSGPYSIPANSYVIVSFAMVGADNIADLKAAGNAAKEIYQLIKTPSPEDIGDKLSISSYPSFIQGKSESVTIQFNLPEAGNVSLDLFSTDGKLVKNFISKKPYSTGKHSLVYGFSSDDGAFFKHLKSGIYFYRLTANNKAETSKILVVQ